LLTKEEHIKYWVNTAKRDWKTIQNMFTSKDYLPALFFSHLHLEKLCKALWVKNNNGNTPPKIHNLIKVLDEAKISYSPEQKAFMVIMNNFQLEGRYPDYLDSLYKLYKKKNTGAILEQVNIFSLWLQQQL
jgi:HEPN domain-containing protein